MYSLSLTKRVLILVGFYLLFLLINLPASQVLSRISLPNNIKIQGMSGTLWQGEALQLIVNNIPVQRLEWDTNIWSLFTGKIGLDIKAGSIRQSDEIAIRGYIATNGRRIVSDGLSVYLPTDRIISRLSLPLPVKAKGRFKVVLDTIDYEQHCTQLRGKGQWINGAVAGTTGWIELGNFNADISCQEQHIVVNVKEPNSFGLSAEARIAADFRIQVAGRFKPDSSLPEEVHQAARFFGQPNAEGYYQLRF